MKRQTSVPGAEKGDQKRFQEESEKAHQAKEEGVLAREVAARARHRPEEKKSPKGN